MKKQINQNGDRTMAPYERKRAGNSLESKKRSIERTKKRIKKDKEYLEELENDVKNLSAKIKAYDGAQ